MDTHDPNQRRPQDERDGGDEPLGPHGEREGGDQPTEPQAPAGPGAETPPPPGPGPQAPPEPSPGQPAAQGASRRLFRSRGDRVLGGVCGGLGRHLGIDPVIVRILALVLLFFGGVSALVYVLALLLVPSEPEAGAPPATAAGSDRGRLLAIVGVVALLVVGWPLLLGGGLLAAGLAIPVALLVAAGVATWWIVSGEGPRGGVADVARRSALGLGVLLLCLVVVLGGAWAAAAGGGAVAAALVVAAGLAAVAGAFVGGVRWLLLPALSLALGVGFVSAAGIDLDGGVGDREYRPASAAQSRDRYELGIGELVVDLRDAELPPGDTPLELDVAKVCALVEAGGAGLDVLTGARAARSVARRGRLRVARLGARQRQASFWLALA